MNKQKLEKKKENENEKNEKPHTKVIQIHVRPQFGGADRPPPRLRQGRARPKRRGLRHDRAQGGQHGPPRV
jgi:hypothetical protein